MQDSPSIEPGPQAPDSLFAAGPARDARYTVREVWRDCDNYPGDHPLHQVEFTHRQMNEEVNGLECSAACLADFPQADWGLRMWFARQCADEARHARMFRGRLESIGGRVGQFPVMNFQYRIICRAESLLGRLTIQNRTFEAGGLDAVAWVAGMMRDEGNPELADFFESQLADEILHVRFANEWLRKLIRDDPRQLLDMSRTLARAARGFREVMGREGTDGVHYPIARAARLDAGFSEDEVRQASELGRQAAAGERLGPAGS